jgi:hypothetical protein
VFEFEPKNILRVTSNLSLFVSLPTKFIAWFPF